MGKRDGAAAQAPAAPPAKVARGGRGLGSGGRGGAGRGQGRPTNKRPFGTTPGVTQIGLADMLGARRAEEHPPQAEPTGEPTGELLTWQYTRHDGRRSVSGVA
jgi:hypothetical protein